MPIATTDLILYKAANQPADDTSPTGGAIDPLVRVEFTQFSAPAKMALVSSGADTRTVTLTFRTAAGALASEVLVLTGTTEVVSAADAERVLSAIAGSTAPGLTVTLREGAGGPARGAIAPGELGFTASFIASASAATGVDRYEKVFWKNAHATLTLTSADVTLTADPAARITIGLCAAKNDSTGLANRQAVPGGVTFVDDNSVLTVPTGALAAGDAIGVWVKQSLLAGDPPIKSTYQLRLRGASA